MDSQSSLTSEQQLKIRIEELDALFENGGVTTDIKQLKLQLLSSQDINSLLDHYQDQLPARQFRLIKNVLNTSEFEKWRNLPQKDNDKREQKSRKLDVIFLNQNIKSDIGELKEAILSGRNYEAIILKYEDQFQGREIKAIKKILNSKQFESFFVDNQGKTKQIQKLFAHINADTTKLQNLLLSHKNIDDELTKLQEDYPRRIYREIQSVVKSDELQKILKKHKDLDIYVEIKAVFNHEFIKTDLSDLIEALILKKPINTIISEFEQKMTGKQYKVLQKILKSPQLESLINRKNQQENSQIFDSLFSKLKVDLKELKQAVLSGQNFSTILSSYVDELKVSDYRQVEKIINSQQFQNFLRKLNQNKTQQKISNLLSQKFDLRYLDVGSLTEKLLKKQDRNKILETYKPELTGKQYKILRSFLQSNELSQILTEEQFDESILNLQTKLRSLGIKINCHKLIQALLKNQQTHSIMQQLQSELLGKEYKNLQKFIDQYRLPKSVLKSSLNREKQEKLDQNKQQKSSIQNSSSKNLMLKFEQDRKRNLETTLQKFNRKKILSQIYEKVLEAYNICLKQREDEEIELSDNNVKFLEEAEQIQLFSKKLKDQFVMKWKSVEFLQTSNQLVIKNIGIENQNQEIESLPLKYLNMSQFYKHEKSKIYLDIDIQALRTFIGQVQISKKIRNLMRKQKIIGKFSKELYLDFYALGVELSQEYFNLYVEQQIIFEKESEGQTFQRTSFTQYSMKFRSYQFEWIEQKFSNDVKSLFKAKRRQQRFEIQDWFNSRTNKNNPKSEKIQSKLKWLKDQKQLNELLLSQSLSYLPLINQASMWSPKRKVNQEFSNTMLPKIANYAIQKFKTEINDVLPQIKASIFKKIQNQFESINIRIANWDEAKQSNFQDQIQFEVIQPDLKFQSYREIQNKIKSFRDFWQKFSYSNEFFDLARLDQRILFSDKLLHIGYYEQNLISLKQSYKNNQILKKYGNKEDEDLLQAMRSSKATSFIIQQIKYEQICHRIIRQLESLNITQLSSKQIIDTMIDKINQIVSEINQDLKQVSHQVTQKFISQLHNFTFLTIWRLKQSCEWQKKQNILVEFSISMKNQIEKFMAQEHSQKVQ